VHISSIALPEGVTPTIKGRDFTIATIAAPSALLSAEAEEGAAAEGEAAEGEEAEGKEGEEEEKSED